MTMEPETANLTPQHERDKETGLDYRGARYYDSDVARFLSTDPWQAKYPEWSTYNYVIGNPIKFTDPTGKGVEYTKEEAKARAARGVKNGYKTEVVANPDKPDDYGVNYKKTVNGKKYEGVQYEGKFDGIVKGGLQKYNGSKNQNGSKNVSFFVGYFFEYSQSSLISGGSSVGKVVTEFHGTHNYTTDGTWNSGPQLKSELFSLGGSYGIIMSTGPAKDVPLNAIEGLSHSLELNASAIVVDIGNKLSWSSEPYNDNGDILFMSSTQVSIGVGTPFFSGGYTNGNTIIQK